VSQLKFGERFFSNRDRLSEVWQGITELANYTKLNPGEVHVDPTLESQLKSPFVFLVCGEVNSGKSSLLNSLFNHDLCPVSALPETNHILRYCHGKTSNTNQLLETYTETYLPLEFLRDFHLIDTPGTNLIDTDQQKCLGSLFTETDLILFVFPASNPWGSATWNLIDRLSPADYGRMIFIIQQTDKLEPSDQPILVSHIADLSNKRIGFVPPIFPVSAKLAAEAKQLAYLDPKRYEASGFLRLENHIADFLNQSTTRAKALNAWHGMALRVLTSVEFKIEGLKRLHIKQNDFLSSLEDEIDKMRESLVSRLPRHLKEVAEVFETEAIWVTRTLKKWLGIRHSFLKVFVGDQTGVQIESLFIERLRIAVEAVAESDGQDVVVACLNHWQELGVRVSKSIAPSIDQSIPIHETLEQARQRFFQRIGSSAHQAIGNLHVRKGLEHELRKRNIALKSFTASTLIFICLAAISGILDISVFPSIFSGIALGFFMFGSTIALITRARISNEFKLSLLDTCGLFAETLRYDYEDAIRLFFQDYTSCLNSIRKYLANEKQSIEPMVETRQKLFIAMKSIEHNL